MGNDEFVNRPIMGNRNDLDWKAAKRRGKTASRMSGYIDLTRHEAAYPDHSSNHEYL